ncbi:MAG TPA: orotidine-5'-phosphate decarboxylase [Gemmatimonadaceae bacterium]|nr:orotidine-5'-phosphate decarboxylase [Gemmatimonadaceae bacterium]
MTAELIVALDYPDAAPARALVGALGDACGFYKVGSELFTAEGPAMIAALVAVGKDVFLDLKFHDIPNTMRGSARSAAALGSRLVTVHASAGEAGIAAAVDGAGDACGVLAVSVLTSLDAASVARVWGRERVTVREEVLRLAELAASAGAHGLVCAGTEAAAVRARFGDALALLVPGVRPAGAGADDQVRVVTPREAVAAGARYVVVGRAITGSRDPVAAARAIGEEVGAG